MKGAEYKKEGGVAFIYNKGRTPSVEHENITHWHVQYPFAAMKKKHKREIYPRYAKSLQSSMKKEH